MSFNGVGTEHIAKVWNRPWDLMADHGEGSWVWDVGGARYLDFTSGIGVLSTGHCHPRVVAAVREQAGRFSHAQANIFLHAPILQLAEALLTVLPPSLDTFFFANSGAEAIEASVKLARRATERPNIIAFEGGFHGRTLGTMALTSAKASYRAGYQPLPSGVFFAPFAAASASGDAAEDAATCAATLRRVRHLLQTQTSPNETAAMLIEPVLGEGGYQPVAPGFLRGLRQICDEHGILLIFDEIQTGAGRTGRFLAAEHHDVVPDIVVQAKGIASGYPLSAIAASRDIMDRWPPGAHGGTYGGNAVACAAATATIEVIREERLVENAARMGALLLEQLRRVQQDNATIGETRGLGCMVATVLVDSVTREPSPELARAVQRECFERGLLLLTCGPYANVVRWIPPLVVTESEIDQGVSAFSEALASASVAARG